MATPSKKVRQKQQEDAQELALLLYDIFKSSETNATVTDANDKKLSNDKE